jgi:hypothetical protein
MEIISSDVLITSDMRKDAEKKIKELIVDHDVINEAEVSHEIKKYFDKKYKPNWQVIIGKNFQVSFSHEENTYILAKVGKITIVLFKMS